MKHHHRTLAGVLGVAILAYTATLVQATSLQDGLLVPLTPRGPGTPWGSFLVTDPTATDSVGFIEDQESLFCLACEDEEDDTPDFVCPVSDDEEGGGDAFVTQPGGTGCMIYADINAKRPFLKKSGLGMQDAFDTLVQCLVKKGAYRLDQDGVPERVASGEDLDKALKECNQEILPVAADGTPWDITFYNGDDFWDENSGCEWLQRAIKQHGFALVYLKHRVKKEDGTVVRYDLHAVTVDRAYCSEGGGGYLIIRDPRKPELDIFLRLNDRGYIVEVIPKGPTGNQFYADTWVCGGYAGTPPATAK
jgi:hypothetical protein